ncbi:MAG: hypothetical protein WB696_13105 [Chthoniobacterales bacterium]
MVNLARKSTAAQGDVGPLSADRSCRFSASACRHDLWQTALEAIGALDIGPEASHFLHAWIAMGVERMQMTACLSPADLAIANTNIKTFIDLMKTEAVVQGHADRLDIETLRLAHRQLEQRGRITTFTLWPFWPQEYAAPG